MNHSRQTGTVRTTLSLTADLLEATDLAAQKGALIDAAFAGMADDAESQAESLAIASEFATAEWEAFELAKF